MKNPKQEQARDLYLQSDLTQTQIADILSIDRKTLYLWIRNNHWDKVKVAARQAPAIVQQDVYNHISAINCKIYSRDDRMPTLQEVEMLRKLFNMVKAMDTVHLGGYIQSFQDFITFIAEFDKPMAIEVQEHAKIFVANVLKDKSTSFHTETMHQVIRRIREEENTTEHGTTESYEDVPKAEDNAPDFPPADSTGSDGKLGNNNITPPKPNTDAPKQQNDNTTNDEKFPKPGFDGSGEDAAEHTGDAGEDDPTPKRE